MSETPTGSKFPAELKAPETPTLNQMRAIADTGKNHTISEFLDWLPYCLGRYHYHHQWPQKYSLPPGVHGPSIAEIPECYGQGKTPCPFPYNIPNPPYHEPRFIQENPTFQELICQYFDIDQELANQEQLSIERYLKSTAPGPKTDQP